VDDGHHHVGCGEVPSDTMKRSVALKRIVDWRLLLFFAPVWLACIANGQSSDDVHISPAEVMPVKGVPTLNPNGGSFQVNVELVLVPVSVSDHMNRSVITLKKEDFTLYEEDKRQEIRYFSAEDAPISVAILLDVSQSMSNKIDTERAAIVEFCNNANPDDEYFAIAFSDRPRVLANSAHSVDDVEKKLIAVEPGGPTAMLDAVYLAASRLRSARHKRKAIVIFSDGGDNASRYTMREVKSMVQESDVQIYAIGLFETFFFNTIEERLGKRWLSEITDVTGGRTLTVNNRAKVPAAAAAISRELRNEYVLGYRPETTSAGRWRRIRVAIASSVNGEPLHAYYKRGYLAPGQ